MNNDITATLLGEISKNQDDLKLFMSLVSGFDQYRRDVVQEFETTVLRPDLEAKILEINKKREHEFSVISCDRPGSLLLANKGITIRADDWPEGMVVQFAGHQRNAKSWFLQICADKVFPKAHKIYKLLVNDFDLIDNIYNKAFSPDFSASKENNGEGYLWFYFIDKYCPFYDNHEALYGILNDINLKKDAKYCPFSSPLIEYIIKFLVIFDNIFAKGCRKTA
jgi:hypothetical protein